MTQKTRTIAGHEITLTVGIYMAIISEVSRCGADFTVSILRLLDGPDHIVNTRTGLSRREANDFLDAFNDDKLEWRAW